MNTKPTSPPPAPFVAVVPGARPSGMIEAEAALLTKWVHMHWREYDNVAYNVRVGRGIDPGPDVPDFARKAQIANSQRRVDAVLLGIHGVTIVEVKVRGSLWAIGQLLGYRALYHRDNPGRFVSRLWQVCGSIDDDTAFACKDIGIDFEVVTL